jgi:hypothetical protein
LFKVEKCLSLKKKEEKEEKNKAVSIANTIISFFPFVHWKFAPCPSSAGVEIFDLSPGRSLAWTEEKNYTPSFLHSRPLSKKLSIHDKLH